MVKDEVHTLRGLREVGNPHFVVYMRPGEGRPRKNEIKFFSFIRICGRGTPATNMLFFSFRIVSNIFNMVTESAYLLILI